MEIELNRATRWGHLKTVLSAWILNRVQRYSGGRPMTYIGPAFRDKVSGKLVNYYIDGNSKVWLSDSRWGWSRTKPLELE